MSQSCRQHTASITCQCSLKPSMQSLFACESLPIDRRVNRRRPCPSTGTEPRNALDQQAPMNAATRADLQEEMRAGDGNRNRMTSLEGWGSTIELRPRDVL